MKRYILAHNPIDHHGTYEVYPSVDASRIESQEALDRANNYFETFIPQGHNSFKGMKLVYANEMGAPEQPHVLCDMHNFVGIRRPSGRMYPVSPKLKEIFTSFHIPELTFYNGSISFQRKEREFYVMHLLTWQLQYINYQRSTFRKSGLGGEKIDDTPSLKGESWFDLQEKFGDDPFTFDEAIMNPEFEELDMYHLDIWGIVITERLKNAIEAKQLTGIKIKECPLDFKIGTSGK